ncbi:DNA repair protein rhp26 [Knufia obscura]|uniref:DNA repair protein rhp26 n=2 Tax=Knufia TaxID=430999 RepID=A0AAN8EH29_9EURO|nr:DNA repair protein rhp26 [Knufia obscura]KAK5949455.1 DNA repair protein rhp26 [Knufia fluminis]
MPPSSEVGVTNGASDNPEGPSGDNEQTQVVPPSLARDESDVLQSLNAQVQDQDDLERNIGREADRLLSEQANQREQQRLDKVREQKRKLLAKIHLNNDQIQQPIGTTRRAKLKAENERLNGDIKELDTDLGEIEERMKQRQDEAATSSQQAAASGRLPNESQRDFLIRTGKITPFSKFGLSSHGESAETLSGALLDAEEETEALAEAPESGLKSMSHRNLRRPGFEKQLEDVSTADELDSDAPRKRRKLVKAPPKRIKRDTSGSEFENDEVMEDEVLKDETSDFIDDEDDMPVTAGKQKRKSKKIATIDEDVEDFRGVDDGNANVYRSRLHRWARRRRRAREVATGRLSDDADESGDEEQFANTFEKDLEEAYMPHPTTPDTVFDSGYKIPGDIYPSLFDYQKTGVQWLHELYLQQVGGIIGDEMGLGKTIQIIAFLAGMHYSGKLDKPVIVVCPATVMKQWVNEFHTWWPALRVSILHSSGSGMINVQNEASREDKLLDEVWDPSRRNQPLTAAQKSARKLVQPVLEKGGVLVTTYSGLQSYAPLLIPVDWSYAILDEGHKIRNPNTAITIYCKELRTPNRIILSGTPMQNNLIELWSLFDFVFPMRLGTLVNFRNQFDIPIRQGGYANASNLQVQTALKCAETLKDAISPYLLQRFKVDVASDLPKKSEQVLFCKLTKLQREHYQRFLGSGDLDAIIAGKRQVLYGVDILRKICNHPDLTDHRNLSIKSGYDYGNPAKSGKMKVVGSLLELWKNTGHKALLFAQHRIMLDILEKFVRSIPGLKYRRMDGNTPIQQRQSMVDEFNINPNLHVFLLTTKVGGLGINLTGADRVLIYDPDWNPSTDLQARERAWRLGQKREVSIYRLMTAGTIEEKIYHRQIFKQFLTNKILKDPKQRQTFHLSDLHDLFSLAEEGAPTETSTLFQDAEIRMKQADTKTADGEEADPETHSTGTANGDSIQALPGISAMEQYAGEIAEEQQANKDGAANSEARMMEGIFSKSGIHSAMEHDAIIGGNSKKTAANPAMVEAEAKRVAYEAAKELEKAGELARTVQPGVPTWTGQFGVSGRPQETTARSAFGSSARNRGGAIGSSSLLAGIQRPALNGNTLGSSPRTASPARSVASTASRAGTPTASGSKDFAKLIRDYLSAHGGSVYTQMLIDHFNRYCTTAQATADFKETLKIIATLDKGGRGRGRWVLKDQYKK